MLLCTCPAYSCFSLPFATALRTKWCVSWGIHNLDLVWCTPDTVSLVKAQCQYGLLVLPLNWEPSQKCLWCDENQTGMYFFFLNVGNVLFVTQLNCNTASATLLHNGPKHWLTIFFHHRADLQTQPQQHIQKHLSQAAITKQKSPRLMRMFQINTHPIPLLSEYSCQFTQISSGLESLHLNMWARVGVRWYNCIITKRVH